MRIGFIDYYLDEWHANNYPAWLHTASGERMTVTCAYALTDSPKPDGRTTAKWCADMGITHCDTIEAVIAQSDALVVLSPDNAEMHEALCQLPLRSGKPTYVDKTFAPDGATARRLFDLAQAHHTPCYTSSALRYAAEYAGIDRSRIQAIAAWGPGKLETYVIHQLEPVMMLMQRPVQRVQYVDAQGFFTLLLDFGDGRFATLSSFQEGSPFTMNLCIPGGNRIVEVSSAFFEPFIASMVTFFETRTAPVAHQETASIMDAVGAALRAQKAPGTWVKVG